MREPTHDEEADEVEITMKDLEGKVTTLLRQKYQILEYCDKLEAENKELKEKLELADIPKDLKLY